MICKHCTRDITQVLPGIWIDPEATGDDSVWRETCDANHEDRIAAHEPEEGSGARVIHTDAPIVPLSQMVGDMAMVFADTANAGTEGSCFYGWGEARNGSDCKPHHVVATMNDVDLNAIAETLHSTGFQVVISDREDWSEGQAILRYDAHHSH
jgi:hypothetical protein